MSLVLASASIELKKIFVRKKYWVLLLLQLLVCAVVIFFSSAGGFEYFGISIEVPQVPYIFLNIITVLTLPLTIFMLCADLFAHELEDLTIKAVLLRPISRVKIYLSKFLAVAVYIFLNLSATLAVVLAIKAILSGGVNDFWGLFSAYTLSIVPMLPFIALGAFLALAIGHSTMSMFCSLIAYLAMHGITLLSSTVGAVFFTSHLEWYKLFAGFSINLPNLLNRFVLFMSYAVFLGVAGIFVLDRKEL